jgi:putative transposase
VGTHPPYVSGTVDQQLLSRNEYLVAENRILKAQLQGRLRLGEIGHRLCRMALSEVVTAALPESIPAWYRGLVARKLDGSRAHRRLG